MTDLTVIILTKNEEKNIEKCIRSFKTVAKRFVVVDSFSTDHTEEICKKLGEELKMQGTSVDFYQNQWINYAMQLNWGIANTSIDTTWTMRMDADEELLPELADEIEGKLPNVSQDVNGIVLKRRLIFMGRWIKHGGRYPEYLLRIWRTGKALCEQKVMDEHMILSEGKTVTFDYDLQDNNQKDLEWWTAKHNWYSNREVLDHQLFLQNQGEGNTLESGASSTKQAEKKRKVKNGGYYKLPKFFRVKIYFLYRYYIKLGFLDGPEGKIYHFLQAYWYRFLVDAKMYECEKNGTKMKEQGELKA
ncbi:MAG: glycosyltransferase family 2 protein [Lachnospiraceae bacterium]|nr:glycosyltransferase family 2 protein [Lachnospiraceae bacterium]